MAPDQINAYERYHDVVIVNTTSKTNQFDMIWVLQELKNSCELAPTALYSDADPALISAVQKTYPDIQHLHCIFHIDLNLRKKLKGKLHEQFEPFRSKFSAMRNLRGSRVLNELKLLTKLSRKD